MLDEPITVVEVQETEYGEVAVLDSPFDAKDFIKVLPWKEYGEEVDEYGSLRNKSVDRGMGEANVALVAVDDYVEDVGFSNDFATHVSWDPQALGREEGAWTIDADSFEESRKFLEFCGFDVEISDGVNL